MAAPDLQVSLHAISPSGLAHEGAALNAALPLATALSAALPSLTLRPIFQPAVSAFGGLGVRAAAKEDRHASSGTAVRRSPAAAAVRVLREGQLVALDPSRTAAEQNLTDGAALLLQTKALTNDELLTLIAVLSVQQGDLQEAVKTLTANVDRQREFAVQDRQFKQRDQVLWFILSIFACLLTVSVGMLVADGLGSAGFQLAAFVRNAIVTSVVGEVAGLVAIVFRFLYPTTAAGRLEAQPRSGSKNQRRAS